MEPFWRGRVRAPMTRVIVLLLCYDSKNSVHNRASVTRNGRSCSFLTRCSGRFEQTGETAAQQTFCSLTQVPDDLSGGLLPGHQPHSFTGIDEGKAVVLGGNRLCKD